MRSLKLAVFFAILCLLLTSDMGQGAYAQNAEPVLLSFYPMAPGSLFDPHEFFSPPERALEEKEPEPTPEPKPAPEIKTATIAAVGDLMVHEWQYQSAYNSGTGLYDFNLNFEMVQRYLKEADLRIGNLETVFAGKDIGYSGYPTFNTPDEFGEALKAAGFDLVSTANNHSLDKREAGLLRTLDVLDNLGISHMGTYRTPEERENYVIKDINGISVAFLSYTYGTNGIPIPAGKDYIINLLDRDLIKADIEAVKELSPDIIIVMPHMGNEYELFPRQEFIDWADFMFDCGADIILASHPHVLQPMEVKKHVDENGNERNVFVAYSTGNFISSQRTEPRDAGIIINIELKKTDDEKAVINSISYIPTWVQFTNQSGANYVRVLGIKDVLDQYENGVDNQLRPKDITRLKAVHKETTGIYTEGEAPPLEEMKEEYLFFQLEPDDLLNTESIIGLIAH